LLLEASAAEREFINESPLIRHLQRQIEAAGRSMKRNRRYLFGRIN
jgi:hypothetical protein